MVRGPGVPRNCNWNRSGQHPCPPARGEGPIGRWDHCSWSLGYRVDQRVIYGGEKINFSCWLTRKPICQLTPQPLGQLLGSGFDWYFLFAICYLVFAIGHSVLLSFGPVFQLNLWASRNRRRHSHSHSTSRDWAEKSLIYGLETKATEANTLQLLNVAL